MTQIIALQIHQDDDVATIFMKTKPGCEICVQGLDGQTNLCVDAIESIPIGHKIALRNIEIGQKVKKYGATIGRATYFIKKGALVDVNNLESQRGRGDQIVG